MEQKEREMPVKLKEIGAVVEKKYCSYHPDNGHWNFPKGNTNKELLHCEFCETFHIHNNTIEMNGEIPIGHNLERLAKLLSKIEMEWMNFNRTQKLQQHSIFISQEDFYAKAIIAEEKSILEVVK